MSQTQFAYPWMLALLFLLPVMAYLRGRWGRAPAIEYSQLGLRVSVVVARVTMTCLLRM